jgi:serine/threonine protein kinase
MYDGFKNDVWSLGIFLCKILNIPHPFIDFTVDTESCAKRKISKGKAEFKFRRHHIGPGQAASLIAQMLERKPHQRITVSHFVHVPLTRRFPRSSSTPSSCLTDRIPIHFTFHHSNFPPRCCGSYPLGSFWIYASWRISIKNSSFAKLQKMWSIDCMGPSHAGKRDGPKC